VARASRFTGIPYVAPDVKNVSTNTTALL